MTPDGVGEVTDFMPVTGSRATSHHRLVRLLRVVRGSMRFVVDVKPRFDYGRQEHHLEVTEEGAIFHTDQLELTLHSVGSLGTSTRDLGADVERMGNDLRIHRTLQEGESAGMVLESGGGRPRRLPDGELERLSHETAEFWRGWLRKSTYTGRWREMVTRSAMTLKLMTYAPSGALVAAPTTGLPEQVGGERNWDYRYTWIRDASFSVHALLGLGYAEEAAAFAVWVRDRLVEHKSSNGECPLRIMYRVDGSSDLTEETLDHGEGWRGSRPVRIGNGASDQLQLDIFGEAMDAFAQADGAGPRTSCAGGPSGTASTGRSWSAAGIPRNAPSSSTTAPRCWTPRCC
jgi:GH15 family glucan-1,4-alpha-glucosidase